MLENHVYNLMAQMVEEHKSLYRIQNMYRKDAKGCAECVEFWEKLEKDKEQHIEDLTNLIKKNL